MPDPMTPTPAPTGHVHDWHERQQGAGRYCPGCDTMEWFPMTPTPDALAALRVWRCPKCDCQFHDATPEDAVAHVLAEHAHKVIVVRHDHGPGPRLDCPDCRKAMDDYDEMALAPAQHAPTGLREAAQDVVDHRSGLHGLIVYSCGERFDDHVDALRAALASGSAGDAGEGAS